MDGAAAVRLQTIAEELAPRHFLGGPVGDFERMGRLQLVALLRHGLYPWSKVVDVGCGCLRGGFWLIHFLRPGCYHGIEPNRGMLELGLKHFIGEDVVREKRPRFDSNDRFDTSVFGERFDFFFARSVWTHASKAQIEAMLDAFVRDSTREGVFLASFKPASRWRRQQDYAGAGWVGRSHASDEPGIVRHKLSWVRDVCRERHLTVQQVPQDIPDRQVWLKVTRLGSVRQ